MTTPGNARLSDFAHALLVTAAATLRPARLPADQYVVAGPRFAHDCDALVVGIAPAGEVSRSMAGTLTQDVRPPSKSLTPSVRQYGFMVWLCVGCAPTMDDNGNPPSAAVKDAYATEVLIDYYDLHRGLTKACREGTMFGSLSTACQGEAVGALVPNGPSGLFVWSSVAVLAQDLAPPS